MGGEYEHVHSIQPLTRLLHPTSGLSDWLTNSRIVHAVSKTGTVAGPYEFKDEVVPAWAHGPSIAVDRSDPQSPKYLLFHIGDGTTSQTGPPKRCQGAVANASRVLVRDVQARAGGSAVLHVADSPDGPWTPVSPPGLEDIPGVCAMLAFAC